VAGGDRTSSEGLSHLGESVEFCQFTTNYPTVCPTV
jgi:hypothetical protein